MSHMVGKPHAWGVAVWWVAHILGGLASQPASFGEEPGWRGELRYTFHYARPLYGHHVFGFRAMYFDQGYQVSWVRVVNQNRLLINTGKTGR